MLRDKTKTRRPIRVLKTSQIIGRKGKEKVINMLRKYLKVNPSIFF